MSFPSLKDQQPPLIYIYKHTVKIKIREQFMNTWYFNTWNNVIFIIQNLKEF